MGVYQYYYIIQHCKNELQLQEYQGVTTCIRSH